MAPTSEAPILPSLDSAQDRPVCYIYNLDICSTTLESQILNSAEECERDEALDTISPEEVHLSPESYAPPFVESCASLKASRVNSRSMPGTTFSRCFYEINSSQARPRRRRRTIEDSFPRSTVLQWPTQSTFPSEGLGLERRRSNMFKVVARHIVNQGVDTPKCDSVTSHKYQTESNHDPSALVRSVALPREPREAEESDRLAAEENRLFPPKLLQEEQLHKVAKPIVVRAAYSRATLTSASDNSFVDADSTKLSSLHDLPQEVPEPEESPGPSVVCTPFQCKVKRVLGEAEASTTKTLGDCYLNSRCISASLTEFGKQSLAPQVLCSPLPKLLHQSAFPQQDIYEYLASPSLTQRIKLDQSGQVVSFSQVGSQHGKFVFILPGIGYTRFVATFLESTAHLLNLCLIVLDSPGTGYTDCLIKGSVYDVVATVDEVCDALNVEEFSVIAHTTGAIAAMRLAYARPKKMVGTITLLSPYISRTYLHIDSEDSTYEPFRMKLFKSPVGANPFQARKQDTTVWSFYDYVAENPQAFDSVLANALWSASTNPANTKYELSLLLEPLSDLQEIKFPCTILHQVYDDRIPISYARRMRELLSNSSLIEFHNTKLVDLLTSPRIMAEVLESIKRDMPRSAE